MLIVCPFWQVRRDAEIRQNNTELEQAVGRSVTFGAGVQVSHPFFSLPVPLPFAFFSFSLSFSDIQLRPLHHALFSLAQLLHVASQKYLTVTSELAEMDRCSSRLTSKWTSA